MKLHSRFTFCAFAFLQTLTAQSIPEIEMPRLADIDQIDSRSTIDLSLLAQRLKIMVSALPSLEYTVERNAEDSRKYTRLIWKQVGEKYHLDYFAKTDEGGEVRKIASYDGERNYLLRPPGTQIYVRDGPPELGVLKVFDSPLILFSFLQIDKSPLLIDGLQAGSKVWEKLTERMQPLGMKDFNEAKCLAVRFSDGFNKDLQQAADYDVYFDPETLSPVGWEAYDSDGFLIQRFEMLEPGGLPLGREGLHFPYPIRYSITQYQWIAKISGPDGPVRFFKNIRERGFSSVKIGDLHPLDTQLDVMRGESIYDVDSQIRIAIPK